MSSILKALKKLEEEKGGQRGVHGPSPGGQYIAPPEPGGRNWLLLVGGVGIGVLLAGGIFYYLGRPADPPTKVEVAQMASSAPSVPQAAPVAKPAPVTAAPQQKPQTRAVAPAAPVAAQPVVRKPTPAPVPQPVATPAAGVAAPQSLPKPVARSLPVPSSPAVEEVEQVQVQRREIPLPGQQWAAPQVTVSEILPDGGGGYMAIVNGLPVMDGTQVENAQVEKIFADRVRFVIDGKTVEVKPSPR